MSNSLPTVVDHETLRAFVVECLAKTGVSRSDSLLIAEVLVETDLLGVHTHGTKLLRDYVRRLKEGGTRAQAIPILERQGPAWSIIDGQAAMGHVAAAFGMQQAIDKAKLYGIAYSGIRNTGHFGAAGYYASMAARQGMIGIAMCNDIPSVAAPGSRSAVLGSNPIAYGIPTNSNPILLDIATSTVAGGKVYAACQRGEPIPDDWIIGPDGLPTSDGSLYPAQTSLAPMAGHKGFGIALLIEVLSGVLPSAATTWQIGSWIFGDPRSATQHGAAMICLSIEIIQDAKTFLREIDRLAHEIRTAPAAVGVDSVRLPGDREWETRSRYLQDGISLPNDVVLKLRALAEELEMHVDWLQPSAPALPD